MNTLLIPIDEETRKQVDTLTRAIGKPEKEMLREVVKAGLRTYHIPPTKGAQALLDLAQWAEEHDVTGPADLSEHLDKYLWEGTDE